MSITGRPYHDGAPVYQAKGWTGIIPLPPGAKWPPPTSFTGWNGKDPSQKMIGMWREQEVGDFQANSNIAIHMPDGLVGIDVDHYGAKTGGDTLAYLESQLGPLPPTYVSTSRSDGISGIRWYRVEPGLRWPTGPGKDIEFIHMGHRYAVVWPSTHPDTGTPYVWLDHSGGWSEPPEPDACAWLPDEWQARFTGGVVFDGSPGARQATEEELGECLTDGDMCPPVQRALAKFGERIKTQARHDAMIKTVKAIVRLGEQGHAGTLKAIKTLKDVFIQLVGDDRDQAELYGTESHPSEFQRAVSGAVVKVLANPTAEEDKRCCGLLKEGELPPEPPPEEEESDLLAGIDPELIAELNAKSREIVAELVADGKLGALFEQDQVWPSPHNPMAVARRLLQDFTHDNLSTLLHWRGGWMEWQHTHWAEVEENAIRKALYHKLEHAVYLVNQKSAKGKAKAKPDEEPATLDDLLGDVAAPWGPNRRKIGDVMEALKACVHVRESVDAPSWLPGAPMRNGSNLWPASETVSCTNGLLHVRTRELAPLTPGFFTQVGVPFNYQPDAPAPAKWLGFLQQLWPEDPDSIKALQEFFGYVLSGRTDLQKIMLMIGPPRSGRGTIARILTALIGRANVANPTLASLGQNFGLQPLVGKPLAIVGDVRLGRDSTSTVVERLLSISGEDGLTCDRKFKEPWTGKLPTRFLLISNELPKFGDASGAIATRFIVLELAQSFLGREIATLTEDLMQELRDPAVGVGRFG